MEGKSKRTSSVVGIGMFSEQNNNPPNRETVVRPDERGKVEGYHRHRKTVNIGRK